MEELDLGMTSASVEELNTSKPKARLDKLLREHASMGRLSPQLPWVENSSKLSIELRFLLNPIRCIPHPQDTTRVGSVLCQRTELQGPAGKQMAVVKDKDILEIPADLVLVSIGYRGQALLGMDDSMFDFKRGIIRNEQGRVVHLDGSIQSGLYVTGWIKRGPTGILGTNIPDARETVQSILQDVDRDDLWEKSMVVPGRQGLDQLLNQRSCRFVDFQDYLKIDEKEKDPMRLRTKFQPREKLVSIEEMVSTAKG
jgi:adrenodoxin-NADP+ reductase